MAVETPVLSILSARTVPVIHREFEWQKSCVYGVHLLINIKHQSCCIGKRISLTLCPILLGTILCHLSDSKKQGAYGKIKTHKESKLSQVMRLDEVLSAVSLLYVNPLVSNLDNDYVRKTYDAEDLAFCDEILCQVSRSFAAVIRQLPPTLLVDVLIFYLVLRALDTVEDDMSAFESNDVKVKHLLAFHKTALGDPKWSMDGVGEGHERQLLQEFPKCHSIFAALPEQSRR